MCERSTTLFGFVVSEIFYLFTCFFDCWFQVIEEKQKNEL